MKLMKWFGNYTNRLRTSWKSKLEFGVFFILVLTMMSFANAKNVHVNLYLKDSTDERATSSRLSSIQLNNKAIPFVESYVRKEGKELEQMKTWGRPYFRIYDNLLTQYGIPKEMKYLSVIESDLRAGLVSSAGAVGPWQLMDYEAKRFGLRVGKGIDERKDFYKSTFVAAKLLKELYDEFGDWLLVIAAYNGGEGRVRQAIQKSGSRDFWELQYYLKEETRNHVKKFIATHYFFEGSGGMTTMTAAETKIYLANISVPEILSEEELSNTVVTEVNGRYNSSVVANSLLMDVGEFNKWNPGFDKTLAEGQKYLMRVPKDRVTIFQSMKGDILIQSIKYLLEGAASAK
jgi:membrane-bound lytic murein transglycosylase D